MREIAVIAERYARNCYGILRDYDGNIYQTVRIGNREWIVKNLHVKNYADGSAIPQITLDASWASDVTGAFCYLDNDSANESLYGLLYNWYAVNNAKALAYFTRDYMPESGWRVANDADFTDLINQCGGSDVAWNSIKDGSWGQFSLNDKGFSALPGQFRWNNGTYYHAVLACYIYSSTEFSATDGKDITVGASWTSLALSNASKHFGFSVRCIRNI